MGRLNVGNIDRLLRILVGLALIGLAATGTVGAWGYVGVVPLLTGLAARCPLYTDLGITTTAEGVETVEQLAQVRAQGCTEAQGYLFSRPRRACDLPAVFAEQAARGAARSAA